MTDTARDPVDIVSENRGVDLRLALQDAVDGVAHWRSNAKALLREVAALKVNEPLNERLREQLREIDARKRAAEITADIMEDEHA